jgi:ankyrin repeat protein
MEAHMQFKNFAMRLIVILLFLCSAVQLLAQDGGDLITRIMYQDFEGVKKLVEDGADVNFQDEQLMGLEGGTPLIIACMYNFADIAKFLIESGADVNLQANNGTSALMCAAVVSPELVKLLLSKGADIHAMVKKGDEEGITAFTYCMTGILSERVTTDLAKLLLDKGANVDEAPTSGPAEGYTCLMMAARNDRPDLVKFLLDNGANINAKAGDGETALRLATKDNDIEMVTLLKELGATQ